MLAIWFVVKDEMPMRDCQRAVVFEGKNRPAWGLHFTDTKGPRVDATKSQLLLVPMPPAEAPERKKWESGELPKSKEV
jgi:hypothetical protein